MYTLLLRFAGPMQSWGSDSSFEIRRTESYPTKSGIIGFLAAALGRKRDESLDDLKGLDIGVRVDQPGQLIEDFHTARKDAKTSYITTRYYLSDAVFLVGVSSDSRERLEEIENAIRHPAFPLYLGRRSCPPDQPIIQEIVHKNLKDALTEFPWKGSGRKELRFLKVYLEGREGTLQRRVKDNPVSFHINHRKYASRMVSEFSVPLKSDHPDPIMGTNTEHDILASLEVGDVSD